MHTISRLAEREPETTSRLVELRREQRRIVRLIDSLEAQTSPDAEWLPAAWRALFIRAVEFAKRDFEILGVHSTTTQDLLYKVRAGFRAARDCPGGLHTYAPDLRTEWGFLEATVDDWELDLVQSASPHFQKALDSGDDVRASRILEATIAQINEVHDNSYVPDDQSSSAPRRGGPLSTGDADILSAVDDVAGFQVSPPSVRNTGAPPGRPRHGTRNPDDAKRKILDRCPSRTVSELRACLGRGRKTPAAQAVHADLAAAVTGILSDRTATREALATALGCGVRTVDALRQRGTV